MYKTISINNRTYQQLHALAAKLQKPKSRLLEDLINEYTEKLNNDEKNSLKLFNMSIKRLSKKVKLPRGTDIQSVSIEFNLDHHVRIPSINSPEIKKSLKKKRAK